MGKKAARPLKGAAEKWEQDSPLRAHAREKLSLLPAQQGNTGVFRPSVPAVGRIASILKPCLEFMKDHGCKVLEIEPLKIQIRQFYRTLLVEPNEDTIYRDAWGIRNSCNFVKLKARRREFSKDPVMRLKCYSW